MVIKYMNTFYFSDKADCYVELTPVWEPIENREEQVADALMRNGLACVSYIDYRIIKSIIRCFVDGKVLRHPNHDGLDTSRDQVIGAIGGLSIVDRELAGKLADKVNWRISKRYMCTPSLWFWLKWIKSNNPVHLILFKLFFLIETLPSLLWTLFVFWIFGTKNLWEESRNRGEFIPTTKEQSFIKKKLLSTVYPGFALFLAVMFFLPIRRGNKLMLWFTKKVCPENIAARLVFGEEIESVELENLPSWNDCIWARYFNESTDVYLKDTKEDNNLPNDFLKSLITRFSKS